nr:PIN domain-containing protein [uncultured Lelliottia sp.]
MHYLFIDTCVWLTIAKSKNQQALLEAFNYLLDSNCASIVIPNLVREEFLRNKERVIEATKQQIGTEFYKVKKIIGTYGGSDKELALAVLNDVGSRLPILSEVTGHTAEIIESLMDKCICLEDSESVRLKAISRALEKRAPFHRSKNSVADSILIELFHEFLKDKDGVFHFVTENYTDFSSVTDRRNPHPDFDGIFSDNVHYHLDIAEAINSITPELLSDLEGEFNWLEDDTRSLTDILSAIDEYCNKVWYNRHKCREYKIETGEVKVVPQGDMRLGNNIIHEDIWERAKLEALKIESRYEDTGPWDDFEWGMINGKLSALRWVLGEEWDMLDT